MVFDQAGEFAGGNAIGFMRHQQAKGLQACRLGQGGKRRNRQFFIHTSRIMDISWESIRVLPVAKKNPGVEDAGA
jgi:hypothetical protein